MQVDMLGSVSKSTGGWCVLVLDDDTTRIISAIVGLSDIIDYGVSCTWGTLLQYSCCLWSV